MRNSPVHENADTQNPYLDTEESLLYLRRPTHSPQNILQVHALKSPTMEWNAINFNIVPVLLIPSHFWISKFDD